MGLVGSATCLELLPAKEAMLSPARTHEATLLHTLHWNISGSVQEAPQFSQAMLCIAKFLWRTIVAPALSIRRVCARIVYRAQAHPRGAISDRPLAEALC